MRGFKGGGRTAAITIVAAIGVLVMLAPSAGAAKKGKQSSGKLVTKTSETTISGFGALKSTTASCPKGQSAIGGGFEADGLLFVYESRRIGSRGWQVGAGQSSTGPTKLTAYAYCRKLRLTEVSESEPLPSGARRETSPTAICEKGQKAISGGFQVPPRRASRSRSWPRTCS